jgi:TP901 family phage tail tape measure protein
MAVEVSDLVAYLGLDDGPFYRGMDSAERRLDQGAVRMRASMATIGQAAMSVGFGIGRELVRGLEAVVQPAMLFEQTMSGVQAVSGATAAQMQRLSDLALQLGKDTTFSAAQAAAGIEELIKGGVSVTDVMNGAAKATLNLAAAGGVDLATAAEIAANALNMFNLSGSQMAHVADEIAGAANASSLSVQDFRYSLAYAGTTAKGLHVSFDDLAVAIAELGQAGIKGSSAGTGLRAVMTALAAPTRAAASEMYRLGIITAQGKNRLFDAQGQMKRLADVQEILKTSLKGMTDQQQTAALTLIFGRQAARVAGIMAEDGAAKFDKMATAMGKVTAQSVAAQRLNNLAGDITNLSGTVETLSIRLGEAFGGGQGMPLFRQMVQAVNSVVQSITGWVQAHSDGGPGRPALRRRAGGSGLGAELGRHPAGRAAGLGHAPASAGGYQGGGQRHLLRCAGIRPGRGAADRRADLPDALLPVHRLDGRRGVARAEGPVGALA